MGQFLEAVRIKPDGVEALSNLGFIYVKQHRMDEAIRQFKEALRIKPGYGPAIQNLAIALGEAKKSK